MFVGVNLKNHYNGQLKNHVGVLLALAVVAFYFLNKKTHLLFKNILAYISVCFLQALFQGLNASN